MEEKVLLLQDLVVQEVVLEIPVPVIQAEQVIHLPQLLLKDKTVERVVTLLLIMDKVVVVEQLLLVLTALVLLVVVAVQEQQLLYQQLQQLMLVAVVVQLIKVERRVKDKEEQVVVDLAQ